MTHIHTQLYVLFHIRALSVLTSELKRCAPPTRYVWCARISLRHKYSFLTISAKWSLTAIYFPFFFCSFRAVDIFFRSHIVEKRVGIHIGSCTRNFCSFVPYIISTIFIMMIFAGDWALAVFTSSGTSARHQHSIHPWCVPCYLKCCMSFLAWCMCHL